MSALISSGKHCQLFMFHDTLIEALPATFEKLCTAFNIHNSLFACYTYAMLGAHGWESKQDRVYDKSVLEYVLNLINPPFSLFSVLQFEGLVGCVTRTAHVFGACTQHSWRLWLQELLRGRDFIHAHWTMSDTHTNTCADTMTCGLSQHSSGSSLDSN